LLLLQSTTEQQLDETAKESVEDIQILETIETPEPEKAAGIKYFVFHRHNFKDDIIQLLFRLERRK
jgi:hypothetical protein